MNVGRNLTLSKKETEPDFVSAPPTPDTLFSPSLSITCSKPLLLSQNRGRICIFRFGKLMRGGQLWVPVVVADRRPFADVQRSARVPTVREDRMGEAKQHLAS